MTAFDWPVLSAGGDQHTELTEGGKRQVELGGLNLNNWRKQFGDGGLGKAWVML